jgi:hypothetical protein
VVASGDDDGPGITVQLRDHELDHTITDPIVIEQVAGDKDGVSAGVSREVDDRFQPVRATFAQVIDVEIRRMKQAEILHRCSFLPASSLVALLSACQHWVAAHTALDSNG